MPADLSRHDRIVIDLALLVIDDGVARASRDRVDTSEVRLALRVLLPHCRDPDPLKRFWNSAALERADQRVQGVAGACGAIHRELRRAGCLSPPLPGARPPYDWTPLGIDPGRWARADDYTRQRLLREARG